MTNGNKKKRSGLSPQALIILLLAGVVGASGVALLLARSGSDAKADLVPRAARVERVEGDVGVAHAFDGEQAQWDEAAVNTPVTVGDRIQARKNSRASLAFTGRNYARLDPGASLDVLSLTDDRTQLALRTGSAIFDLGDLESGELFEVATPNGAIDFVEPGLYQVGFGDNGSTMISVLSGLAQVVGLAGSGEISKGEMLTLVGQTATQLLLSKIAPDLAGGVVDDYYGYRYRDSYDGRYRNYDAYLDDPDYYDPYRQSVSYRYLQDDIPGVYDLDNYGDWNNVDGYGRCWSPRVEAGWAPYRDGSWDADNVWGPTWVSREPWGWAPYHYGRWAYVNNSQWAWVPDRARSRAVYSPALVAFVPVASTNQIAWAPLAPGETYLPRYYNASFQPQYLDSPEVVSRVVNIRQTFVNFSYPAAVTAVPVERFTQVINPGVITQVNPQLLAQSQPVIDPYTFDGLRQVALSKKERRRLNRQQVRGEMASGTPVVTSVEPVMPRVRDDMIGAMQVATVPEKQKKQKMKFDRSNNAVVARRPDGLPQPPVSEQQAQASAQGRGERMTALSARAAQGDASARRKLEKIERRESRGQSQQVVTPGGQPVVTTDQTREQRRAEKQIRRQQTAAQQPRVEAAGQTGAGEQRRAEKQLRRQQAAAVVEQQRAQQQAAGQARASQERAARKAQRRAEAQQRVIQQQRAPAAEQQPDPARAQRKAERRAAREQQTQQMMNQQRAVEQQRKQSVVIQQTEKEREQRRQQKMERRAARQQAAQPQQPQAQQPQPRANKRVEYIGPPAAQGSPDREQRRAEKAARKAARRNN
jgi:uncharacterized protein DUF6600